MPVTEPVISKYDPIYWVRWLFFPVLNIGCIYAIIDTLLSNNWVLGNPELIVEIILSVFFVGFYKMLYIKSFPKTVLVTVYSITIDEYSLPKFKHITIKYADIKETGTYRQQGNFNRYGSFRLQPETLNIELHNGESYEISENDFSNYNNLKSAIYDHLFRHK
jgi:hypothetical protein